MSTNDLNDSTLSRLSKAADWLQRLHQSPDEELLLEKCLRWLDAAPENAASFERMETVWQAMGQLATNSRADADSQCGSRELQAGKPGGLVRRRVPATMPPVKQQLPRPARISRPPAQA
jgi:ferric-dicitrate binding protein FerR (iron transport regulator)